MAKGRGKRDVADLRFDKGRFTAEGFPLEGIQELHRYQALVLEVAKQLWREANPERQRLPKGFEATVRLRLTRVRKGSAIPVLEREPTLKGVDAGPDLLELSIEYIDNAFAEIVKSNRLPWDASDEAIQAFVNFGQSLEGKERAEFRASSNAPTRYTHDDRARLLKAMKDEAVDTAGTLVGRLETLSSLKAFVLVDAEGRKITGRFSTSGVFADLHALHNVQGEAELLWLEGKYTLRPDGTVARITDVTNAGLFAKSTNPWAIRLARLAALPSGWLDGDGERVEVPPLQAALVVLEKFTSDQLATPGLYADPDGGVRLEWLTETSHTVLRIGNTLELSCFHLDGQSRARASEKPSDLPGAMTFVRGYIDG